MRLAAALETLACHLWAQPAPMDLFDGKSLTGWVAPIDLVQRGAALRLRGNRILPVEETPEAPGDEYFEASFGLEIRSGVPSFTKVVSSCEGTGLNIPSTAGWSFRQPWARRRWKLPGTLVQTGEYVR